MKKILKIFLIIIFSFSIFNFYMENNIYASSTTTYDKKKALTPEKQSEYDRVRNRNLKSLSVKGYDINPVFNRNTIDYYLTVSNDIVSLKVDAIPENPGAKVTIKGNEELKKNENENEIVINVRSENGLNKTYKIHVNKYKESSISLKSLEIKGYKFENGFSSKKYNYNIDINQNEVQPLKITAKANDSDANVEIIGNDSTLSVGSNVITILVTKGSEVVTYQLNVKISTLRELTIDNSKNTFDQIKSKISQLFNDNNSVIALLSAVSVVLIIIIVRLIKKVLKKKRGE